MKRFLACLVLCASLSASAQDDNCTVLGIQDLTQMVLQLQSQLDSQTTVIDSIQQAQELKDRWPRFKTENPSDPFNLGQHLLAPYNNLELIDFSNEDFRFANLQGCRFVQSIFDFADLDNANLSSALAVSCDWRFANLSNANLKWTNLTGGDFTGANFHAANLTNSIIQLAEFTSSNLTCLREGCPSALPSGYICEPDPDCSEPDRYRIVPE